MNANQDQTVAAINLAEFSGWGGGIELMRLMAAALQSTSDASRKVIVLFPQNRAPERILRKYVLMILNFRKKKVWEAPLNYKPTAFYKSALGTLSQTIEFVPVNPKPSGYKKLLAQYPKLTLLPTMKDSRELETMSIGYIYDFQHEYLQPLFSESEVKFRRQQFAEIAKVFSHVIVNAQSVKADFKKFFPNSKAQVHAMPFSPILDPSWLTKFECKLPDQPYFIVCNQFWKHKDHPTAIKAFAQFLKASGQDYHLVCTGLQKDSRFANYFEEIEILVEQLGLKNKITFTGHISKREQIELMKNSMAVVQPTHFEGGPLGGAGYDALALGKRILATDLPVNLEVQNNLISYFAVQDVGALTQLMVQVSEQGPLVREPDEVLISRGLEAQKKLGHFLWDAVKKKNNS